MVRDAISAVTDVQQHDTVACHDNLWSIENPSQRAWLAILHVPVPLSHAAAHWVLGLC